MNSVLQEPAQLENQHATCPYNGITVCKASLSSLKIDAYQRDHFCVTEDFDDCPIFLSKVLRRS